MRSNSTPSAVLHAETQWRSRTFYGTAFLMMTGVLEIMAVVGSWKSNVARYVAVVIALVCAPFWFARTKIILDADGITVSQPLRRLGVKWADVSSALAAERIPGPLAYFQRAGMGGLPFGAGPRWFGYYGRLVELHTRESGVI